MELIYQILFVIAGIWSIRNLIVALRSGSSEARDLREGMSRMYGRNGAVWQMMKEGKL